MAFLLASVWGALVASATRLVTFAVPAVLLSARPWFELRHLWYISVATVALQALVIWWLLEGEFRGRSQTAAAASPAEAPAM